MELMKAKSRVRTHVEDKHLVNMLLVELHAATTKEDIHDIIDKLNKIRGVNFPE